MLTTNGAYDVNRIRADFPALAIHLGHAAIVLRNGRSRLFDKFLGRTVNRALDRVIPGLRRILAEDRVSTDHQETAEEPREFLGESHEVAPPREINNR